MGFSNVLLHLKVGYKPSSKNWNVKQLPQLHKKITSRPLKSPKKCLLKMGKIFIQIDFRSPNNVEPLVLNLKLHIKSSFPRFELAPGWYDFKEQWRGAHQIHLSDLWHWDGEQDQDAKTRWSPLEHESWLHCLPQELQDKKCSFYTLYKVSWAWSCFTLDYKLIICNP